MQEQTPYKTTADQGWAGMKTLLDREMPVQRRKRGVLFWWLTAGAAVLALITTFVLTNQPVKTDLPQPLLENNDATVPESNPAMTSTEMQMHQQVTTSAETEKPSVVEIQSAKTTNDLHINKSVVAADQNISFRQKSEHGQSSHQIIPVETKGDRSETAVLIPSVAMTLNGSDEMNISMSQTGDSNEESADLSRIILQPVQPLSGPDQAFIYSSREMRPVAGVKTESPKRNPFRTIRPFADLSGLIGFDQGSGYTAGVGAEINLGHRLYLEAGVGYQKFTPNASLFSTQKDALASNPYGGDVIVQHDTLYPDYPVYVSAESLDASYYGDVLPIVKSISQLQLHAGANWAFSPRFFLKGGLGWSVMTRGYSEYPILETSNFNPDVSLRSSRALEDYNIIRSNVVSFYGGVGYRLSPHFSIYSQIEYAFESYLSAADSPANIDMASVSRSDYLRGVSLGLRYSL